MPRNELTAIAAPTGAGTGWSADILEEALVVSLSGDWTIRDGIFGTTTADSLVRKAGVTAVRFEAAGLRQWDSSLLAFLSSLRAACRVLQVAFDESGLPEPARRLLAMLPAEPPAVPEPAPRRTGIVSRIGFWTAHRWSDTAAITTLVGDMTLRTVPAMRGKARARLVDLWTFIQDAGVAALPMVLLVNMLVGGIVTFVGSIQLIRFGAAVYVSNMIGIMEVRELAPLITAIVMSGRTGSAYAAEIATMQGSDEIDALRALGIPLFDYLIIPRIAALSAMLPLLFIYAAAVGIAGGLLVAISLMNLSVGSFLMHLRSAVAESDLFLGLVKSMTFGVWIAISSCRIGLQAGRSATDVGLAATTAAVGGIVGVIALDAVFDVCANSLGL